jgi:thioredoxin-like negative regulator of GroEL
VIMAIKILILAGALVTAIAALGLWRRTPRIARVEPESIGASGPAIVQFGTPHCGPCQRDRPLLERAAREMGLEFVDVDLSERPDLASRYRIRSVPLVLVTTGEGRVVGRWPGAPSETEIRSLARTLLDVS